MMLIDVGPQLNPLIDDMARNHVDPDDFVGYEDDLGLALLRRLAVMAQDGKRFKDPPESSEAND